jgi:hypothetical protein
LLSSQSRSRRSKTRCATAPPSPGIRNQESDDTDAQSQKPIPLTTTAIAMYRGIHNTRGSAKPPGRNPATRSGPVRGQGSEVRDQIASPLPVSSQPAPRRGNTLAPTAYVKNPLHNVNQPKMPGNQCHRIHITKPINPDAL